MLRSEDRFEEFRDGMNAGYNAWQKHDLLYAAGFLVGFVWGALSGLGEKAREEFDRIPRRA
jgi:hypothetical protein